MPLRRATAGGLRAVLFAWRLLRRFEARVLILMMGVVAALWAFLELAGDVSEGDTEAFDRRLVLLFRTPGDRTDPIGSRVLEEAVRDVTALGGFTFVTLATIVAVLAFLFHGRRRHALVLAGVVTLAWISSETAKALYGRERPDFVPHDSYVYSASFPSGHSTLAAATFLTIAVLVSSLERRRRTKALVYGVAVAVLSTVGLSRVYLGVHWPSDVLAGWCLGAAWALAGWITLRLLQRRASQIP